MVTETAANPYTAWKRCDDCGIELESGGRCESCREARKRRVRLARPVKPKAAPKTPKRTRAPRKVCKDCGGSVWQYSATLQCRSCARKAVPPNRTGVSTTVCSSCGEAVPTDARRYWLVLAESGGKSRGRGRTIVRRACEGCGEVTQEVWDKHLAGVIAAREEEEA